MLNFLFTPKEALFSVCTSFLSYNWKGSLILIIITGNANTLNYLKMLLR